MKAAESGILVLHIGFESHTRGGELLRSSIEWTKAKRAREETASDIGEF
jgi:hypothetical protein